MLVVSDFLDQITIALHEEFGSGYKYYVEEVEQKASKPCFVVGTLNPMITSRNPTVYRRVVPVVVHYFTNKKNTVNAKEDCYSIAERLWNKLEYLSDGEHIVRGEEMYWEIVEGVLQFFITYTFDVERVIDETLMEEGALNGTPIPNETEQ